MSKRSQQEVEVILKEYGLKALESYKGAREPFKCLDENGYTVLVCIYRLRAGKVPAAFHANNPYTIDNIKVFIKNNNLKCELIDIDFQEKRNNLTFKCSCGNVFIRSWDNLKTRKKDMCNVCNGYVRDENNYIPYDIVMDKIKEQNYIPLFNREEYKGATTNKLLIQNQEGYKCLLSYDSFTHGKSPAFFHSNNPYTIDNIKHYLDTSTKGEYICLSETYINDRVPLTILHKKCNETFEASWANLRRQPTLREPNRHGTECPFCTGLRTESLHALVLKQLFLKLVPNSIIEEKSCRNPINNYIMPTDIVNHDKKIAIEVQSWYHDFEDSQLKDRIKKQFWLDKGYSFYDPDIRNYTVLEMAQLFFPEIDSIPDWINYEFSNKLDVIKVQRMLDEGLVIKDIAEILQVPAHRINDAVNGKRLTLPLDYHSKVWNIKPITQLDFQGNFICTYPSIIEASRTTGVQPNSIRRVLKKTHRQGGGHFWCYEKDYLESNYTIPEDIERYKKLDSKVNK